MIEEIISALIAGGVPQALAKLLAVGISYTADEIVRVNLGPTAAGTVREIILGVEKDYPTLDGVTKRGIVADAVAQYLSNHGAEPTQKAIDTLIQLAVNDILGTPAA